MSDGFLGRWSKRKLEAKQGKADEAGPKSAGPAPAQDPPKGKRAEPSAAAAPPGPAPVAVDGPVEARMETPPPTLEDVQALTPESDYARFAAPGVTPQVKNAAMKKLFADPRYNVMDGLDVYTGDYSQPDPMPDALLRRLASAKFLGLFDDVERKEEVARQARDVADNPKEQTVAQSEAVPPAVHPQAEHADPDLRLQQDHAAPGEDPGSGAG
jgi:hypothetical protein